MRLAGVVLVWSLTKKLTGPPIVMSWQPTCHTVLPPGCSNEFRTFPCSDSFPPHLAYPPPVRAKI